MADYAYSNDDDDIRWLRMDAAAWRKRAPAVIRAAAAGDAAAWEELYLQHRAIVLSLCLNSTGDEDAAQDIASMVWERVFLHIGTLDPDSSFTAWLCRITKNACIDVRRARRRWRFVNDGLSRMALQRHFGQQDGRDEEQRGTRFLGPMSLIERFPDPAPGPEEIAERRETRREARAMLARGLRELQRGCDDLRVRTGGKGNPRYNVRPDVARWALAAELAMGTHRDIHGGRSGAVRAVAAAAGIGFPAAKSRLSRGRMALRAAIELTGGLDGRGPRGDAA